MAKNTNKVMAQLSATEHDNLCSADLCVYSSATAAVKLDVTTHPIYNDQLLYLFRRSSGQAFTGGENAWHD
ncbi:MAG: hypothetical protein OEV24_20560 [Cyclobacteriaceae bacterium]|nr:hypothetical protein [Cyclobacteriaceae bacterium]MDH5250796.1 hypothetical protein [Cyclobacteriaceae bacterium]